MKNRGSFAAVVERDTGLRTAWAGVLQDCGLPKVLRRARPAELRDTLTEGAPLSALIVGLSARHIPDEAMLTLIATARRHASEAVILAIDHANRSQGAIAAFAAGAEVLVILSPKYMLLARRSSLLFAISAIAAGREPAAPPTRGAEAIAFVRWLRRNDIISSPPPAA